MKIVVLINLIAFSFLMTFGQLNFPKNLPIQEIKFKNTKGVSETYNVSNSEYKIFIFFDIETEPGAEILYTGSQFVFEKAKKTIFPIYFSGELVKKRSPEFSKGIPTQLYRTLDRSDYKFFDFKKEDMPFALVYNEKNEYCGYAKNVPQLTLLPCVTDKKEAQFIKAKLLIQNQQNQLQAYSKYQLAVINAETKDTIAKPITDKHGDFAVRIDSWITDYVVSIGFYQMNGDTMFLTDERGVKLDYLRKNKNDYEVIIKKDQLYGISDIAVNQEDFSIGNICLTDTKCNEFLITANVNYTSDEIAVAENSKYMLEKLVEFLKKNAKYKLTISSYVGNNVNSSDAIQITQKRAQLIMDYFISKGIKKNRFIVLGIGNNEIRNRCQPGVECSVKEHNYNVRTDFKFQK
jgi:outer membrane protein OmpA-like peptidoglycan-associated protein